MADRSLWEPLAKQFRADSIRCTTAAGSGHPTSGMSAADLMSVLAVSYLRYDFTNPEHPNNDHLLFSKGHACPVLYALYKAVGAISDAELLTLRQFGSKLEGHPTPEIPYVDAATGSLGQGLPIAVGIAMAGKHLEKLPYKVYCVLGDSEMAEGSIYEGFAAATEYGLDNLIAILDCNRLGQRGPTALEWHTERYKARAEAFGWEAIVIDGHDLDEIDAAYARALKATRPVLIIAKTEKGRGVSFTADKEGWHGKAMKPEEQEKALAELDAPLDLRVDVRKPEDLKPAPLPEGGPFVAPAYTLGEKVATRQAYGDAIKALGASRGDVVALDAEVGNSTFSETFEKAFPDRFFQMYIAEQMMLSAAQGISTRGRVAFAATFAAFFSRAYDQIRMAAVSRADLHLCGSHAGVSIGEDGPSQMALEDLAMFRAVNGSAVLYPSDAVSTVHLIKAMSERKGVSYLRSTREKTPVLYGPDETFPLGGSKTLREGDAATVIAAGITLHEALKAADELAAGGVKVRVIDLYSVKPIDAAAVVKAARETGHLIVAEDHWAEGGLGDATLAALAEAGVTPKKWTHLCVREMPRSGKPDELLEKYGISAAHIAGAVKG
ncbi:MAG TPA: transketolase [Armatimonadaceae bacterium]|nr:transketolase [Armatimonadaceae bacterium]